MSPLAQAIIAHLYAAKMLGEDGDTLGNVAYVSEAAAEVIADLVYNETVDGAQCRNNQQIEAV